MKVLYIIPFNKIGGAEMAFNSVYNLNNDNIEIVKYDLNLYSNNPILYIKSFFNLAKLVKDNNIKVVVSTLWKSHLIILLVSIFFKIQIVPFIVGNKFFNLFDRVISSLVIKKAKFLLVDSHKGGLWIKSINPNCKIFSFLIHTSLKIDKTKLNRSDNLNFNFLFVGRVNHVKRLDKAFEFLNQVYLNVSNNLSFDIYGPLEKGFDLDFYLNKFNHLNIKYKGVINHVDFPNVHPKYNFFLQFSDSEGSGMSVIEAMRYGLIPVITNVGEVVSHCEHGVNSIICDTSMLPIDIMNVFKDVISKKSISFLSKNSYCTFNDLIFFNDVLLTSLNEIYLIEYKNE